MTKRKALGRGLEALIPTHDGDADFDSGILTVPIDAIRPNPHQPRTEFNAEALQELANSIREHGLIQPLIVTQDEPNQYTLIAGERRWRACRLAALNRVPVVIKDVSSQARLELALVENIQRADLNPIEEAMAYNQLLEEFALTQAEAAQRVGKSRSEVANKVGLLKLPEEIQAAVSGGQISYGHARALITLPTPAAQLSLMRLIIRHDYSVRQAETIARKIKSGEKPPPKPTPLPPPELSALEAAFRDSLGTRVRVQKNKKGAGKVVIHFYSDEELQSIYEAIVKEQ